MISVSRLLRQWRFLRRAFAADPFAAGRMAAAGVVGLSGSGDFAAFLRRRGAEGVVAPAEAAVAEGEATDDERAVSDERDAWAFAVEVFASFFSSAWRDTFAKSSRSGGSKSEGSGGFGGRAFFLFVIGIEHKGAQSARTLREETLLTEEGLHLF